ncbi:F-box protein [Sansalvadorimonas verongulae]|uniref:F-box protein n=1 Tax=Sansalvadorimonas verongulae TaxID=2172824 RepID=UPI0012BC9907|nr:F-box protein [Sansalvadorimonas verongulae]MTI15275.1 F-box protein [Sansalvadorimonas verongulae]
MQETGISERLSQPGGNKSLSQSSLLRAGGNQSNSAGRGLTALPDSVFHYHILPRLPPEDWKSCSLVNRRMNQITLSYILSPPPIRRYLLPHVNSPGVNVDNEFSLSRFTSVITPWLDRCDASLKKALNYCTNCEDFPLLLCGAVGIQLREAASVQLKGCENFVQHGKLLTCVAPGRYELIEYPPALLSTSEWHKTNCCQGSEENDTTDFCTTLDQKRFARLCQEKVLIHELGQDSLFHKVAQCDAQLPVMFAQWSSCGQLLLTLTKKKASLWSMKSADVWEEEIHTAISSRLLEARFSPDSCTVVCLMEHQRMKRGDSNWSAFSWCRKNGLWIQDLPWKLPEEQNERLLVGSVFSKNSTKLALRFEYHVQVWCRSKKNVWEPESVLSMNWAESSPYTVSKHTESVAFNIHGQVAVAWTLKPPSELENSKTSWHTGIVVWNASRNPYKKQVQITTKREECEVNPSSYNTLSLFFSPDGRFLIGSDNCKRTNVWCQVPEFTPPDVPEPENS